MSSARIPDDEAERLAELRRYRILDTLPEQAYDDITYLASMICDTPIALVSLVDSDRQWFKSKVGLEATETPRDLAFCAHAILDPTDLLVVPDATQDERFAGNPLVVEDPRIRFYAGAPLTTSEGHALGTLCVIDRKARELSVEQGKSLAALSRQVMAQFELRHAVDGLERYRDRLESYQRKLETANDQLRADSLTDALTGLANRAAFELRLAEEFERARRHDQPLSLFLMDIDRFKTYNDEFGHPAGDQLLRTMGRLMLEQSRTSDVIARYGGEEFVAILPATEAEGAAILAERFRHVVEREPWELRPVTLSIGVAIVDDSVENAAGLLAAADRALYQAKRSGRNRVVESWA